MKTKLVISAALLLIICTIIGYIMTNRVETPKYQVLSNAGNIEIREYSPMIIAETKVTAERQVAIKDGFKVLADYIFGNNAKNQKIAMTAPVMQQKNGDAWNISFVMPSEYSISSLPTPNSKKVALKEISSKKFVVIRFSGTHSPSSLAKNEELLLDYIKTNKVHTIATAKYTFYNPPWTLPFMRRNEIMFEIRKV